MRKNNTDVSDWTKGHWRMEMAMAMEEKSGKTKFQWKTFFDSVSYFFYKLCIKDSMKSQPMSGCCSFSCIRINILLLLLLLKLDPARNYDPRQ